MDSVRQDMPKSVMMSVLFLRSSGNRAHGDTDAEEDSGRGSRIRTDKLGQGETLEPGWVRCCASRIDHHPDGLPTDFC